MLSWGETCTVLYGEDFSELSFQKLQKAFAPILALNEAMRGKPWLPRFPVTHRHCPQPPSPGSREEWPLSLAPFRGGLWARRGHGQVQVWMPPRFAWPPLILLLVQEPNYHVSLGPRCTFWDLWNQRSCMRLRVDERQYIRENLKIAVYIPFCWNPRLQGTLELECP